MKNTMLRRLILLCSLLLSLGADRAAAADDALYRAWGGRAGIEAVMTDLVARLKADARVADFFRDSNAQHLASQLTDQLCQLAGGPCVYDGPTMHEAHAELDIGRAHFLALVELLQDSMAARGVPWRAQQAMLALLAPMHRDIVRPR